MSSIRIKVEVDSGAHFGNVVSDALSLSRKLGIGILFCLNNIEIEVDPGDDYQLIRDLYCKSLEEYKSLKKEGETQ